MQHLKSEKGKTGKKWSVLGVRASGGIHDENALSSQHVWGGAGGKGGDVAAQKGNGKKSKGGKGKFGKGSKGKWNGNGKGYQNYSNSNYNQRYPGKVVGKGLNAFNNDYYEAWGDDAYNGYNGDGNGWWGDEWFLGNGMNVMMMLERDSAGGDKESETEATDTELQIRITGERGPLRGTRRVEPIKFCNKFNALQDIDDEDECEEDAQDEASALQTTDCEDADKTLPNINQTNDNDNDAKRLNVQKWLVDTKSAQVEPMMMKL